MQSTTDIRPTQAPSPFWHALLRWRSEANTHWHGGLKLRGHKTLSNRLPIQPLTAGNLVLQIPLGQGARYAAPCVVPGQYVLKGEVIARGEGMIPWVHASTSGWVEAIGSAQAADQADMSPAISLRPDGAERWYHRPVSHSPQSLTQLADLAREMGIVGLGGAGFPTSVKLGSAENIELLLINGAECEPFITCDDRLMRERAAVLIAAADLVARLSGSRGIRFGIEANKPEAIAALRSASHRADTPVEIRTLPARYPAGGQPLLVKALSGRTLLPGELPAAQGLMVLNVATLFALGEAALRGRPLISRVLTLTGLCQSAGNVEVPIGFPVSALAAIASPHDGMQETQIGGPMMGRRLTNNAAVVGKTTSCLIFGAEHLVPQADSPKACIRCTRCVDACPMGLRPLDLFDAAQREDNRSLKLLNLNACIECGCCSHSCPSALPLRDTFRQAKQERRA